MVRTFARPASSNGYGAVMVDFDEKRVTHFREHLFAREEPRIDASGMEVWTNNQPEVVHSRDLLYDTYFGIRVQGGQTWLTNAPPDFDKSGYAPWAAGKTGGTGVVTMVQDLGPIETTEYVFAPRALPHAGFVMVLRVKNTSAGALTNVAGFSLHNFHLGFGRPGVMADIGENGETIAFDGAGHADFLERGFAGVVVARALGPVLHHGASNAASPPAENVYDIVNTGSGDLPDLNGEAPTADGSVSAFELDLGSLAPGEEKWIGIAVAHDGDPFGGAKVEGWLDAYVGANGAKALVDAEIASYAAFQAGLAVPPGLGADEESLLRQSAVMLEMAQVREDTSYLREFLTKDGEPRYSRFSKSLPGDVTHKGKGAVLASLPPGEWTVCWARDTAYSTAAMAALGMKDEAAAALHYYLGAEAGRFQDYDELKPYAMPPYQISLVRYFGFGVEETDFSDSGPNLEFDGFGLFLWALRHYEELTKDTSIADNEWPTISTKVADVLVALVDPATGLIKPDSSIWESHWNGRQRSWAYTDITAARGLCDAAAIAERMGDMDHAKKYEDAGNAIRAAIAAHLTDPSHAIASNAEELAAGEGYWDAAVFDAIAMGLFDPKGAIAKATFAGIDEALAAPAGAGWSRNDDRYDHQGKNDLSPWGSEYDSAEWVFTDLRGEVAARLMGDAARSDHLLKWIQDQSIANYLAVSETYDEGTGTYKFNAPMIGFGAGAYALAIASRAQPLDGPACGAYFDEGASTGPSSSSGSSMSASSGAGGQNPATGDPGGCGCRVGDGDSSSPFALAALALALAARSRRLDRKG